MAGNGDLTAVRMTAIGNSMASGDSTAIVRAVSGSSMTARAAIGSSTVTASMAIVRAVSGSSMTARAGDWKFDGDRKHSESPHSERRFDDRPHGGDRKFDGERRFDDRPA